MGYTTYFDGHLDIAPPLDPPQAAYLVQFSRTRRMKRDAHKCAVMPDPIRVAANLPIGQEGEYFTGGAGHFGQDPDPSVLELNEPPAEQPGLWCGWTVSADGQALEWNGAEKFYDYGEWLQYLIEHFFVPWQRTLTGTIGWLGEDRHDRGRIVVQNNKVELHPEST